MPNNFSRRAFLGTSVAAGAAFAVPLQNKVHASANDEIGLGLIGAGGRGQALIKGFSKVDGVNVVAIADPDEGRASSIAKKYKNAKAYSDLRKLLDDPAVDAVVIATCNHWHCLAAVWALQAGKDVYVEKPLSHSQWEGLQVVKAARKYNKICQVGTQQRSDPMQADIKKFLHGEKGLGEINYVQANRLGKRASIGKRDTPLPIPENIDYDLWLGPAKDEPIFRDSLHYNWHWDWNTGSGEMGNWGVHVLDDVRNVVFQDTVTTPKRILAAGGRVHWNDAGNTPNVHYTYFDTGKIPTLIALSNLRNVPKGKGNWSTKCNRPFTGPSTGYVVGCEGGYYLGQRGSGKAVDLKGNTIKSFKGGDSNTIHKQNFIDAVRARDNSILNTDIQVGHDSTGWCNLANVGYRTGAAFSMNDAVSVDSKFEEWKLLLGEMKNQLAGFDVKLDDESIRMSPLLTHDPNTERFTGDHADVANHFLKREYRGKYVVPETV